MLRSARLRNAIVSLEPLEERHRERLRSAGAAGEIWTLQPFNIHEGFDAYFDAMLAFRDDGSWLPFAVVTPEDRVVGQSCYLEYRDADRSVEIGGIWYSPEVQGTLVNPAAKLLLLDHAFEAGMVRVQLNTDVLNARSRAAILKLGAIEEGVLRKHRRKPDGTWRDSIYFSITDDEWPQVRNRLEARTGVVSRSSLNTPQRCRRELPWSGA